MGFFILQGLLRWAEADVFYVFKQRDRPMRKTTEDKLRSLVTTLGYEFVGYELGQENRCAIFRLFIDSPGGISVADCTRVSHNVGALFDVEDPVDGPYRLEMSSPSF